MMESIKDPDCDEVSVICVKSVRMRRKRNEKGFTLTETAPKSLAGDTNATVHEFNTRQKKMAKRQVVSMEHLCNIEQMLRGRKAMNVRWEELHVILRRLYAGPECEQWVCLECGCENEGSETMHCVDCFELAGKYRNMGLVGDDEKRGFPQLFTPMALTREGSFMTMRLAELFAGDRVDAALCVIEAVAGMGKTTMMQHIAREQGVRGWEVEFDAVVMVELKELNEKMPEQVLVTGETILRYYFGIEVEGVPHWERVLWLFDGYDEVLSTDKAKFRRFVRQLGSGALVKTSWGKRCVVAGRPEGRKPFKGALRFQLQQWSEGDIKRYARTRLGEGTAAYEGVVRLLSTQGIALSEFMGIPLITEIVCTVYPMLGENPSLSDVFEELVVWMRHWATVKQGTGYVCPSVKELSEVAWTMIQSGSVVKLGLPHDVGLIKSGFVHKLKQVSPLSGEYSFLHKTLLNYLGRCTRQ